MHLHIRLLDNWKTVFTTQKQHASQEPWKLMGMVILWRLPQRTTVIMNMSSRISLKHKSNS
eukprot:6577238-Karenia_brevis.AAC.1